MREGHEKAVLKLNSKDLRSWHLVPSLHGKLMGKQWLTLFFGALKSLKIVPAAMKLKYAYSSKEKLYTSREYIKAETLLSQQRSV